MDHVEQFEHAGFQVRIDYDTDPESPREWDNLGTMVCWHGRYNLGDTSKSGSGRRHPHDDKSGETFADPDDFRDWWKVNGKGGILMPLFLYDHSGISISTARDYPFNCPWDSGQVGYVYATLATLHKEYGKRITKAKRELAVKVLRQEVSTYDDYLTGQVYCYTVETEDGEHVDSCCGFYGLDYCISEAKQAAECAVASASRADSIMHL